MRRAAWWALGVMAVVGCTNSSGSSSSSSSGGSSSSSSSGASGGGGGSSTQAGSSGASLGSSSGSGPSSGGCQVAADCDDHLPCTVDACDSAHHCIHVVAPQGSVCRASAGVCDVADHCDGVSTACPADDVAPNTTVCRPVAGDCDVADLCDGVTTACPATDAVKEAGVACGAGVDLCHPGRVCSGTGAQCPAVPVDAGPACAHDNLCVDGVCDLATGCTYPFNQNLGHVLVSNGIPGQLVNWDLLPLQGSVGSGTYITCAAGPNPGATPPRCIAQVDLALASVNTTRNDVTHTLHITGTMPMRVQDMTVDYDLFSIPSSFAGTLTGNATCPGQNQTYAQIPVDVVVNLSDPDGGPVGVVQLVNDQAVRTLLSDQLTFCGGVVGNIVGLLKPQVALQLYEAFLTVLQKNVNEQLCALPTSPGGCPAGSTASDGGLCLRPDTTCASAHHLESEQPGAPGCMP